MFYSQQIHILLHTLPLPFLCLQPSLPPHSTSLPLPFSCVQTISVFSSSAPQKGLQLHASLPPHCWTSCLATSLPPCVSASCGHSYIEYLSVCLSAPMFASYKRVDLTQASPDPQFHSAVFQ
ncbi:hypothetical protein E2C01_025653 [Portunus trituberculatus]|uniref:Uncharacterized protein n=1 Tax=Portunus trituberculatus TaxID=210409 RepID=A0A5B7EDX1_PORTR|nr:hypothetical protein [Portunus trituberculatus]